MTDRVAAELEIRNVLARLAQYADSGETDAYVALYPFLNKVVVPAGLGDLAKNRPAADVALFAPKASLVVRKDLHSAIQYVLLTTAVQSLRDHLHREFEPLL